MKILQSWLSYKAVQSTSYDLTSLPHIGMLISINSLLSTISYSLL